LILIIHPSDSMSSPTESRDRSSGWWNSVSRVFNADRSIRINDDEDEDTEPLLPSRASKRRRLIIGWEQVAAYLVLLALGLVVGGFIGRRYSTRDTGKDHGPMVAPVWTLPPVSSSQYVVPQVGLTNQPSGLPRNPAFLTEAHTGAVAAEDETCSNLGLSILRDHNGTAVDAAVTTTLCIGLLNAFSSGIGGGGFMVIRVPEGDFRHDLDEEFKENGLVAIDFRETSPAESDKEMYGVKKAGRMAAQVGGLAVGVPGELRGLELGMLYQIRRLLMGLLTGSALALWLLALGGGRHASSQAS
jgi:gamma-glutamyltranspeptidase/glutathione hydrolase/leukotriene-C4 hydrolase